MNDKEEARERGNRRRSKKMVRGFQRFPNNGCDCSNRCLHEKGQQLLGIFETLKDRLMQKGTIPVISMHPSGAQRKKGLANCEKQPEIYILLDSEKSRTLFPVSELL